MPRTRHSTPCSFEGCKKPMHAKSFCQGHYVQHRKGQKVRPLQERRTTADINDTAAPKRCSHCQQTKPRAEFHANKTTADRKSRYCKLCIAEKAALRADHRRAYQRRWYEKNRTACLERAKKRSQKKQEEIRAYRRDYYGKNKTKIKAKVVAWQKAHPHIIAWRGLLKNSLASMNRSKNGSTHKLLGYSATELKAHLETLWTVGMSWENYGEWHIDHIRPIHSFASGTPPHIVNALSNLQPLWKTTRIIEGIEYLGNLNKNGKWTS